MSKKQTIMKKFSQVMLILSFLGLSLGITYSWHLRHLNMLTGDEPHYMVMTDGLVKYKSFEQTQPYKDEFRSHKFYKYGLAQPWEYPTAGGNTHAAAGPRGLFNLHNIGLPILLVVPYLIGDIIGVRIFMALLASMIVYFTFKLAQRTHKNATCVSAVTFLICFSASLLPPSTQIFPDLPTGLFTLAGMYWLFALEDPLFRKDWRKNLLLGFCVAYLPWLHLKLIPTSFIIMGAALFKLYNSTKNRDQVIPIGGLFGFSFITIMAYTYYAFGRFSGPHETFSESMLFSKRAIMIFFGLIYDQNQGFFFQNLFYFFGLLGIYPFFSRYPFIATIWSLVFLSLIVPNSLHPVYYGGYCLTGRFQWSAAVVFIIPTIFGLVHWMEGASKNMQRLMVIFGAVLHSAYFYAYAILGIYLYPHDESYPAAIYSKYYPRVIQDYLPMFYNPDWYGYFWPNYLWGALILALLAYPFLIHARIEYPLRKHSLQS
jgi:hypothetical protein